MPILDEKDMDKRLRNPSGHFSITIHDESVHNLNDLTEMMNDTNLRENQENQKIFNAKFT